MMWREFAGAGCLYALGLVFGLFVGVRLEFLGLSGNWALLIGAAIGLGIGYFLASGNGAKQEK